jgi:hypothetical protein
MYEYGMNECVACERLAPLLQSQALLRLCSSEVAKNFLNLLV